MKVFISADMEGVAGVVHSEHTLRDGKEHERARKLMTQEVNAAIEGALEAGAKQIIVNDSHGTMRNIIPEDLNETVELITGSPKPLSMMQGIDSTFKVALFVGYHAMRGAYHGVLEHTYHGNVVSDVFFNGKRYGETGMNAAVAGYFKVPVALVTGDQAVTEEARLLLGNMETVTVKEGVGRNAAKCLSPFKARSLIKSGAKKALLNVRSFKPLILNPPIKLEMVFFHTGMADMAEMIPDAKRKDGRTVSFIADDYMEVYKAVRAMIALAATNI